MRHIFRRTQEKVRYMSIGKKLILSGYLIMTPILLCISALLAVNNYWISEENTRTQILQNTKSINEGIRLLQGEMEDICTYISINTDINQLLTTSNAYMLNMDSQIWTHKAPVKMVEDMAAIKGYIKTIALYPENGLRPYLRCFDATSHISTKQELRESEIYQTAVSKKGKMGWIAVGKYDDNLYQQNRKEKLFFFGKFIIFPKSIVWDFWQSVRIRNILKTYAVSLSILKERELLS